VEESVSLGRNIPLLLLDEPLDAKQCPCYHEGLSNIVDRGYGLRSVVQNLERDSVGRIYINLNLDRMNYG
jgi:hypothetical protein